MKSKVTLRSILRWGLLAFIMLVFFAPATFELLKEKWAISYALANAKSVRLEHYHDYFEIGEKNHLITREQIFSSKNLAPKDFHLVGDAFPICLDVGFPGLESGCIFDPHHRIIITDASGNVTTIRVCFECDHIDIAYGDQKYGDIVGTPFVWMATLRHFFAEEGMPNSPELYRPSYTDTSETNQAPAANK